MIPDAVPDVVCMADLVAHVPLLAMHAPVVMAFRMAGGPLGVADVPQLVAYDSLSIGAQEQCTVRVARAQAERAQHDPQPHESLAKIAQHDHSSDERHLQRFYPAGRLLKSPGQRPPLGI
jgi:hypothetical protein